MLTTYPLQAKRKYEWKKDYGNAFQSNFHSFPCNSKIGAPVYLIISPFSHLLITAQHWPVSCQVKVEVCIVPVLSHNRWGGNEFKDIVEEGSPVLKQREQRARIQGNDPYSVLWVYVTQAHKGSFIAQLSYATLNLFLQIMGITQWSQSLCICDINKLIHFAFSHIVWLKAKPLVFLSNSQIMCFLSCK